MLNFFKAITGLKVNVGKSENVPVGEVGNLDGLYFMLQGWLFAHILFVNASWDSFQGCFDLEPYYRNDGEKALKLEAIIFIKRG